MGELYQQSTAETDAMFKQSTEKFGTMVQAMKQMAAEMHNELEATRNELRRGVLEMPQEAADNTAQMRKVIVDQIEALAELNRIVAHHGRGLDVVTQGRASVQRQEEPLMAVAGGRNDTRIARYWPRDWQCIDPAAAGPRDAVAPHRSAAGLACEPGRRTRRMAVRSPQPHRRRRRQRPGSAPARTKDLLIRWNRCRSTSAG